MIDFTGDVTCASCKKHYSVELRRMRFNLRSPCPVCGLPNGVTEKQAIEAQRLLERLEAEKPFAKVA
jgi:hypothetical protein